MNSAQWFANIVRVAAIPGGMLLRPPEIREKWGSIKPSSDESAQSIRLLSHSSLEGSIPFDHRHRHGRG